MEKFFYLPPHASAQVCVPLMTGRHGCFPQFVIIICLQHNALIRRTEIGKCRTPAHPLMPEDFAYGGMPPSKIKFDINNVGVAGGSSYDLFWICVSACLCYHAMIVSFCSSRL